MTWSRALLAGAMLSLTPVAAIATPDDAGAGPAGETAAMPTVIANQQPATEVPATDLATTPAAAPVTEPQRHPLGATLKEALTAPKGTKFSDQEKEDRNAIAAFSDSRNGEPLWVTAKGLSPKAAKVIVEIKKADHFGLDPKTFDLPELQEASDSATDLAASDLANAEIKISLAILKYARHAKGGRITEPSEQLSSYLDRAPAMPLSRGTLEDMAKADEPDAFLRGLHPKHEQFEKLRQQYLALKAKSLATPIAKIDDGNKIKPGERHAHVALVRQRLALVNKDVAAEATDGELYDEALVKAVTAFQTAKDFKLKDGVINSATRKALNAIETPNPKKLLANMEQWRWMPENLGDIYVWVNIPEFAVRVVKNGEVVHTERIISGQNDKQTPIFSHEMEAVIFHPRWNVPESIKVNELWPGLARGGDPVTRQGLKLMYGSREVDPRSVDWGSADIRNYDIYQPPGGANVLGVVKFTFPNKHQVYMHDTTAKPLFNETTRTFSHGCMRVRNPMQLAEILLAADKGWSKDKVNGILRSGEDENEIRLEKKIPVHVTYFTASVGEGDAVDMRSDVYGHEKRITLALDGKWGQIDKGRNHLAPVRMDPALREIALSRRGGNYGDGALGDFFKNLLGGF